MNKTKVESKLLIYQKYVDVIEYGYNLLRKYPKSEKYGLTSEIRRSMFQVIRLILYANKISNKYNKIDAEITSQKFFVRFSYKCRYISNSNYYEWSKRLDEIGKNKKGKKFKKQVIEFEINLETNLLQIGKELFRI